MKFILKLFVSALAVIVSSYLLKGVKVDTPLIALIVAAVLSFLNAIVKPIIVLFTIPITIVSLGLFLIVINAIIILLADYLVDGFHVNGFWWALLFSFILSLVTSLFESIADEYNRKDWQ
jgi:putative membrane protein